jgi:hypothetical protein
MPNQSVSLEISIIGIEMNFTAKRMTLVVFLLKFQQIKTVHQEFSICINTKFKLKEQTDKKEIKILHGQDIVFKTKRVSCMIQSIGTHLKNMSSKIPSQL